MTIEPEERENFGVTGASVDIGAPVTDTPDFAKKARDLDALRGAVTDAATVGVGLWLSYLFVLLYLSIAVGSVTHRNLLLESPVKLPFLGVDLPLTGFFVLAPGLLLIVHAYVLLHFALLASKVGAFDAELEAQISDQETRARLRRQLPSNIFVQFLAGPREVRTGVLGFLLRLIAQISLVIGPLTLLVFFQFQFLPYHAEGITWWQRTTILTELALLWTLWPLIARGNTTRLGWRDLRRGKIAGCALASFVPVVLAFAVATFPGEWLDTALPSVKFVPTKFPEWRTEAAEANRSQSAPPPLIDKSDQGANEKGDTKREISWVKYALMRLADSVRSMGWVSLHELLIAGHVDLISLKPRSLWSNRLVLPHIEVIDHPKFDSELKTSAAPAAISLRGRRLEGSVLVGANLRNANFTGAYLTRAVLDEADLRGAKFDCAFTGSTFTFKGSDVPEEQCADLTAASLERARLEGASLAGAQLQGANLASANLQGANLSLAQLQGAKLQMAQLQGASLDNADLEAADLIVANLEGASALGAQLQGAVLQDTNLQGAFLNDAQMYGASLIGAKLQGASLVRAELQGAWLSGANFQDACLDDVFVWRTDSRNIITGGTSILRPETAPKYHGLDCEESECMWSPDLLATLKRLIEAQTPRADMVEVRDLALKRIAVLDPNKKLEQLPGSWANLERLSPPRNEYEKVLARRLQQIGCNIVGAPYVVHALLQTLDFRFTSDDSTASLARAFLDEAHCPGARGLSEEDKLALQKRRDSAAQLPNRR